MRKDVQEILSKYVLDAKSRGVGFSSLFNELIPEKSAEVIQRPYVPSVSPGQKETSFDAVAKPVLTSWLKGRGGLGRVTRYNTWDTDKVGGVTANEYYRRAKAFDNPNLPDAERMTQMIYGVETSGNPEAWRTVNKFGYMGRAQMGSAFMKDYGIDRNRYMSDPKYQHEVTRNAVEKRIRELKGIYY